MHGVLPIFRIFDFDKWSSPPERQNRCTGFDSFRLLITRHDKITEKFGAVLTAALCIMVGLKFAYMSLAFSSSSWFGITDVASAILICAAVHLAYAAVLFAVSIPFYHLFQRLTSKK